MRTLSYTSPSSKSGPPGLAIVETAVPSVGAGEVLVRVHYAGLSHFETLTWQGKRNRAIASASKKRPAVSGIEMAGVIETGGARFNQGDRVVAYTHIFKGPFFHAEYASVPESNLALLPDEMSLEGAASIVGGGLTAINAVERIAAIEPSASVLVTGATGSVGLAGVQLATHLQGDVSAVCHSTSADLALTAGATQAFAYDRSEMPDANGQFDLVFDTAPSMSFSSASSYLQPRGAYVTTMPHLDAGGFIRSRFSRKKWGYLMESDTDVQRMERLRTLIAEEAFRPVIDSVHPLAQASDAFDRQQERGRRGKILLDLTTGS